jgi:two-component system chemotaxis response regulator CheY
MGMPIQKKLILVVDDDPDICDSLETLFTDDGYRVVVAKDGQDGLEKARQNQPDVILLDVMMPILDGYGFLDAQKADPTIEDIPVIVLSAGLMLDRLPKEIPRLPKPPELLALFALVESRVQLGRKSKVPVPTETTNAAIETEGSSIAPRYHPPEATAPSPAV